MKIDWVMFGIYILTINILLLAFGAALALPFIIMKEAHCILPFLLVAPAYLVLIFGLFINSVKFIKDYKMFIN